MRFKNNCANTKAGDSKTRRGSIKAIANGWTLRYLAHTAPTTATHRATAHQMPSKRALCENKSATQNVAGLGDDGTTSDSKLNAIATQHPTRTRPSKEAPKDVERAAAAQEFVSRTNSPAPPGKPK